MDIPNLPTDNLYKFKALSGLILIIFSIILYVSEFKNLNEELISIEAEIDIKMLEIDFLLKEYKADSIELAKLEKDTNKANKDAKELLSIISTDTTLSSGNQYSLFYAYLKSKDKAEARNDIEFKIKHMSDFFPLENRIKLIQEREKEIDLIYKKMKLENAEHNGKIKKAKFRLFYFLLLSIILILLIVIGFRLANKGFRDWYNLVQKYQDEKLKMEVEQMKKAINHNKGKQQNTNI